MQAQSQQYIRLNDKQRGDESQWLETELHRRVIGQSRAIKAIVNMYESFNAGLTPERQPISSMLFLGPTGSGKTRSVEAFCEVVFGSPYAFIKIDCSEFQHSHEIAKLIGSPPGYLGHRETPPVLTQEHLNSYHTERHKFTVVLFDEIEKASDALWQLLLGILDKAVLTLGDNRRVDFTRTMVFMTSNLGARDMSELVSASIGFAPSAAASLTGSQVDQKLYQVGIDAARRKFSPEFINRLDKVIVFRSLKDAELMQILEIELSYLQRRIMTKSGRVFVMHVTDSAKRFLLQEGIDYRYGARHLKRAIRRFLEVPISRLLNTNQICQGDTIKIDMEDGEIGFFLQAEPTVH